MEKESKDEKKGEKVGVKDRMAFFEKKRESTSKIAFHKAPKLEAKINMASRFAMFGGAKKPGGMFGAAAAAPRKNPRAARSPPNPRKPRKSSSSRKASNIQPT